MIVHSLPLIAVSAEVVEFDEFAGAESGFAIDAPMCSIVMDVKS